MRNRPFFLPVQKSDPSSKSPERGNLKKEFYGKKLFRSNLYNLVTGNLEILETTDNKWFLDELFSYSFRTHDPNLLKALQKIASAGRFDESVRQHASEIAEIIDDDLNGKGTTKDVLSGIDEKSENARRILAGIRYPQTTEVLRLLRDKSVELKRLALWLIGKFRMTDLSQEVCECLAVKGLEEDAFEVLTTLGSDVGSELKRYYLTSAGNTGISKAILRLFSRTCPKESMSFLVERLWSTSRQLREITLRALITCGYVTNDEEKERLKKMIFDTFGVLTWILSGKVSLSNHGNSLLYSEMNKEYIRWKDFLLNLLFLTYGNSIPPSTGKIRNDVMDESSNAIPDLTEIIFAGQKDHVKDHGSDDVTERKILKKLQHYFPLLIPEYYNLLEDIINHDYNVISVWTKVCTIRSISKIESENMAESIVALLFSPEEILREEATRLIARSGMELYSLSSDRIREQFRKKLDDIIKGNTDENELVFEKVKFIATCFSTVHEDELIYLAERISSVRQLSGSKGILPPDSLIWGFREKGRNPEIIVNHSDVTQLQNRGVDLKTFSYAYILPFSAIEDFGFQFPENSEAIYSYIDRNEA